LDAELNLILGVAKFVSCSRFKPVAVNEFNSKFVVKGAVESFDLFILESSFKTAEKPTSSFVIGLRLSQPSLLKNKVCIQS